jgi:serpin B
MRAISWRTFFTGVIACAVSVRCFSQPPAATDQAARAVNSFGVALHQQSAGGTGNTLISPWSLQSSLAMAYAGASGETRKEMTAALSYGEDEPALHQSFQSLRESFDQSGEAGAMKKLHSANRIYFEQTLRVEKGWLELTRTKYLSEAQPEDFKENAGGAAGNINEWVKTQTNGKILNVIPEGALSQLTRLVIVNALHFDFPWDEQFTKSLTREVPFHLTAGLAKVVPLMFKQHRLRYAQKPGFQIAGLPYAGGTMQFVVLLPDAVDGLAAVERALTADLLAECSALPLTEVRLSLPRLEMEPRPYELRSNLEKLGMKRAFDEDKAEFERLAPGIHVSKVYHQTMLELDEEGTKAASAAAVVMRTKNGVPHEVPHKVVKADHPFLFLIQHIPSGTCLFIGKVMDPAPSGAAVKSSASPAVVPQFKK